MQTYSIFGCMINVVSWIHDYKNSDPKNYFIDCNKGMPICQVAFLLFHMSKTIWLQCWIMTDESKTKLVHKMIKILLLANYINWAKLLISCSCDWKRYAQLWIPNRWKLDGPSQKWVQILIICNGEIFLVSSETLAMGPYLRLVCLTFQVPGVTWSGFKNCFDNSENDIFRL